VREGERDREIERRGGVSAGGTAHAPLPPAGQVASLTPRSDHIWTTIR